VSLVRRVASACIYMFAMALAVLATSCGPDKPAASAQRAHEPRWADALGEMPELYVVVRPGALKRDATFGPFFQTLMRIAQARRDMGGATVLEAMTGADEVILGARSGEPLEMILVVRGVPAQLDPSKVQEAGHPIFRLVGEPHVGVAEYERLDRQVASPASLFVLPKRTWVVAVGAAKDRARAAFARPTGRPVPRVEEGALMVVRLDGPTLARRRMSRSRGAGVIESLGKKLASVSLSLQPGSSGVKAALAYEDDDASAWAENAVRRVVELAGEREGLAWLREATVGREGTQVLVTVPLPPRLLDELPKVTGGDFL
jgi:hypothetical protein